MAETPAAQPNFSECASEIVATNVAGNHFALTEVPDFTRSMHDALAGLDEPTAEDPAEPLEPAVPIMKSVTHDDIASLEEGRKSKSMQRHLVKIGLTPEQYRAKWSLSCDCQTVSAACSRERPATAEGIVRRAKRS